MAVVPHTNAKVEVNAVDLSSYCKSATLNYNAEMLDKTAFGATSRAKIGGLKTWSLDLTFNQDYGSTGTPDALLWALVGTSACYEYRAVNACATDSNPIYTGVGCLESFPIGGTVGALLEVKCTVQGAGNLERSTSS